MVEIKVTAEDREMARDIIADMGEFEEGITDLEKMAQWVRHVRVSAERSALKTADRKQGE